MEMTKTFSILTLNCYGVPAPGTSRRLATLARTLNYENLSVVCLQEVQANTYCKQLTRDCVRYPFQAYEPFVHAPKGGLLTLSQQPIDHVEYALYQERGLWYTPAIFDWILHKGILVSQFMHDGMPIVVINTHLTANYTGDWSHRNPYARHEHRQLQQLAALVQAQPQDAIVLVCGDFNIPRGSWLYDSFLEASGLIDPRAGDLQSTLRPRRMMPDRYFMPIDYALVRAPAGLKLQVESNLRFEEKVYDEGRHLLLSDHYAVELRLSWD
jgi:endonuclease/exonuclease/phosphatase family metal-dependent hydrolase